MTVKTILVAGAGFMGSGIAQVSAAAGYQILLWDVEATYSNLAVEKIAASLDKRIAKNKLTEEEKKKTLANIKVISNLEEGHEADLVIEAIIEDLAIKSNLFKKLDAICRPETIFASNTSAIPVSTLANSTHREALFIGAHFFSPVPAMKLVEIVQGLKTAESTCQIIKEFVTSIGKTGVVVKDGPGFLVNRVMHAFRQEVFACLEEGVASLEDIDTAVKLGLGHPLGPFELNDFAGLDIGNATIENLYDGFKDPKWAPNLTLKRLVEARDLGRKTGKGWYDYTSGEKKPRKDLNL